ncbi:MAG: tRNA uridine-5-carboxymethylaminomethyl(34) synthesis GTPase MnmE [Pseudomonadota bacterium]
MHEVGKLRDTIVALSSGAPPAAIGVVRVSGPLAHDALQTLAARIPEPRRASVALLRDGTGDILDEALILWFPGTRSATGEDLVEFHCHGGRAVVEAIQRELTAISGVRAAQPGEFTRRAFANGRIDLAEAEGLGDLLAAETEMQRASAIANAQGAVSSKVAQWRDEVLRLSALVEAALDFSDEGDVDDLPESFSRNMRAFREDLSSWLERPRSEKLGEGFRVALAGPPNAGKSTLFNALVESEAAITSPTAGTTRDAIERRVAISGVPFSFVDTAGLRDASDDTIEMIGIDRARAEIDRADLVLWLGDEGEGPDGAWEVAARSDAPDFRPKKPGAHTLSALTAEGLSDLKHALVKVAYGALPKPGEAALNARQHAVLSEAREALAGAAQMRDPLLVAEELRRVRLAFDRVLGKTTTEDMLDALFGRFCIGK